MLKKRLIPKMCVTLNQNNEFSTYQKLNKIIEMHNEINNNMIDQHDGFRKPLYDHR